MMNESSPLRTEFSYDMLKSRMDAADAGKEHKRAPIDFVKAVLSQGFRVGGWVGYCVTLWGDPVSRVQVCLFICLFIGWLLGTTVAGSSSLLYMFTLLPPCVLLNDCVLFLPCLLPMTGQHIWRGFQGSLRGHVDGRGGGALGIAPQREAPESVFCQ